MIEAPFEADRDVAGRMARLAAEVGPAVERDLEEVLARQAEQPLDGSTVSAADAARLVERHGLASPRELALLALPTATRLAQPPISSYHVGAVGIEAGSGDLVLGGNVEFPGTDLQTTVHAEGFVSLRARRRRAAIETLAVREAHPCAHCRQTLAESSGADDLRIIDPLGRDLSLAQLYPWAFGPGALGLPADDPGNAGRRKASLSRADAAGMPADAAAALEDAAALAHAPYSGAPSAVALRTGDGRVFSAGCVESVAFNPTITATMAALVEVLAARVALADVAEAWLAHRPGAHVDPEAGFRALLAAAAPGASLRVLDLQPPA